jgi:hypothetical protein
MDGNLLRRSVIRHRDPDHDGEPIEAREDRDVAGAGRLPIAALTHVDGGTPPASGRRDSNADTLSRPMLTTRVGPAYSQARPSLAVAPQGPSTLGPIACSMSSRLRSAQGWMRCRDSDVPSALPVRATIAPMLSPGRESAKRAGATGSRSTARACRRDITMIRSSPHQFGYMSKLTSRGPNHRSVSPGRFAGHSCHRVIPSLA